MSSYFGDVKFKMWINFALERVSFCKIWHSFIHKRIICVDKSSPYSQ